MIVVLNGPLGIGKSTLAEALSENIDNCVMLDGDCLVAAHPSPPDELDHLHSTIELLISHHRRFGYRHFVIDHIWRTPAALVDLRRRLRALDDGVVIHCFLLTVPLEENRRRIEMRQRARALDEREFEDRTVKEERDVLFAHHGDALGEPFDVSAAPETLVDDLLRRLALR